MKEPTIRCAIYCRKSSDEGLEQRYNSLDAQRETCELYIASMKHEGWVALPDRYDDGGFSGGSTDRPALKRLLADIESGRIDRVLVYKIDRLSRSIRDFALLMERFEGRSVGLISVTQALNTRDSMGRLVLHVLLSFAQFEREMASERTRDKIAASRRKGIWTGGRPILGYDIIDSRLVVNESEAGTVRAIFAQYLSAGALQPLLDALDAAGVVNKAWTTRSGIRRGGEKFHKSSLARLLSSPLYAGLVPHKKDLYPGQHDRIVDEDTFRAVQRQLADNRCLPGGVVRGRFGGALKGILVCRECGALMSSTTTKRGGVVYRYYQCPRRRGALRRRCRGGLIPAEQLERIVADRLPDVFPLREFEGPVFDALREQAERDLRVLRLQKAAVGTESATVGGMPGGSDAELDRRLKEAEAALPTRASVAARMQDLNAIWSGLAASDRAALLRAVLDKVEYDSTRGELTLHPKAESSASTTRRISA